ncbi:MAG: hypothetical protein EOP86_13845 [Verrucomicrobiaceae bacterium]|nr:MAG: hypothetical protein EOP86_13845 [Verrucomicrobiaceae bacterium]
MREGASSLKFQPGDHPDDYCYLFEGHSGLLTDSERYAWRRSMMLRKIDGVENPRMKSMMERHWLTPDDSISQLLAEGEQPFLARTLRRIIRECSESLNTCPRCGSLCRTSEACLCPHCSHTWFEVRGPHSPGSE